MKLSTASVPVIAAAILVAANAALHDQLYLHWAFENATNTVGGDGSGNYTGISDAGGNRSWIMSYRFNSTFELNDGANFSIVPGVIGNCAHFLANNPGNVVAPLLSDNSYYPDGYTVSLWFKTTQPQITTSSKYHSVLGIGSNAYVRVYLNDTHLFVREVSDYHAPLIFPITMGEWTHFTVSFQNTSYKGVHNGTVYINGAKAAQLQGYAFDKTRNVFVFWDVGGDYPMMGSIDEVKVWTRILTDDEVHENFRLFCPSGGYFPANSTSNNCSSFQCAAGTTDDDTDSSTQCVPCAPGAYVPAGSSGACSLYQCIAGSVDSDNSSATECNRCKPTGIYVPAGSAGSCSDAVFKCKAGTIDNDSDPSTECVQCKTPGSYVPPGTAGTCKDASLQCVAGTTDNDSDASTECVQCSSGHYVPAGSVGPCSGFACPADTWDNDSNPATPCAPVVEKSSSSTGSATSQTHSSTTTSLSSVAPSSTASSHAAPSSSIGKLESSVRSSAKESKSSTATASSINSEHGHSSSSIGHVSSLAPSFMSSDQSHVSPASASRAPLALTLVVLALLALRS